MHNCILQSHFVPPENVKGTVRLDKIPSKSDTVPLDRPRYRSFVIATICFLILNFYQVLGILARMESLLSLVGANPFMKNLPKSSASSNSGGPSPFPKQIV